MYEKWRGRIFVINIIGFDWADSKTESFVQPSASYLDLMMFWESQVMDADHTVILQDDV